MKSIQNQNNQPTIIEECPNCWGRQSYCGNVYENLPIGHIPNPVISRENFIRRFVIQHIEGIRRRLGVLPQNH